MDSLISSPLFTLGFSLLALGYFSEIVVSSGARLAKTLRISELTIGFILISVLTSLPELSVSIGSSSAGNFSLSVGNVLGANVVDIALVLGLGFVLFPKRLKGKATVKKLAASLLLTSGILILFLLVPSLGRFAGILLLSLFVLFCLYLFREKFSIHETEAVGIESKSSLSSRISRLHIEERILFAGGDLGRIQKEIAKTLLHLVFGILLVTLSANAAVSSATSLARSLGIASSVIGALVVAIGTTVPELTVGLVALRRGHLGLALGDSLGSTVTNLTLVLGSGLLISHSPIKVSFFSTLLLFALLTNVVFWYLLSGEEFGKPQGALLLAIYSLFVLVLLAEQVLAFFPIPFLEAFFK